MKKIFLWMILGSWLVGMALAGCGQTGPLYLPKQTPSSPAAASPVKPIATPMQSLAAPTKSLAAPDKSVNPSH